MKRILLLAFATAIVPAVLVPGASAQAPVGDSVTGSVTACASPCLPFRPDSLGVDARSGPGGENPVGTAEWQSVVGSGFIIGDSGAVTCLAVSGRTAILGFSGRPGFIRTLVRVTDGGPSLGQDSFAVVTQRVRDVLSGPPSVPPPDCSSFPPSPAGEISFGGGGANTGGDITVIDAPPPTSKDQCKHGGWGQFGFGNKEQCLAALEDRARQECIYIREANGLAAFRAQYGRGADLQHAMRNCIRERMND